MNFLLLPFALILLAAASAGKPDLKLNCLVGGSILVASDYDLKQIKKTDDYFSSVALLAIENIILKKPFDQKSVSFKINIDDSSQVKLTGYLIVKESYDQVNLSSANCKPIQGNTEGFIINCSVVNPSDNQKLILNYNYKYKLKQGYLELKISESKLGLLAKNKFSCLLSDNKYLLAGAP